MAFRTLVLALSPALNSTAETESVDDFILPAEAESDSINCPSCDELMVLMDVDDSQIDHERRMYGCPLCGNAESVIAGWVGCYRAKTAAA